jgi:hypothetical protein
MIVSRERLLTEATATGFAPTMLAPNSAYIDLS